MTQVLFLTLAVEKLQKTVSENQMATPKQEKQEIEVQQQQKQSPTPHIKPTIETQNIRKKVDAPTNNSYQDDEASLSDSSTVTVKSSGSKRTPQKHISSSTEDNPFIEVQNKPTKKKNSKKQKTSDNMDDDNP